MTKDIDIVIEALEFYAKERTIIDGAGNRYKVRGDLAGEALPAAMRIRETLSKTKPAQGE